MGVTNPKRRDPTTAGGIAVGAIWLWTVLVMLDGIGRIVEICAVTGFGKGVIPRSALAQVAALSSALQALTAAAFALAALAVLRWVYVTNRNAHALDDRFSTAPQTSPAWAVGWFFVPIVGLIKPLGLISETWRISVAPKAAALVEVPAMLRWWWGLWLANGLLSLVGLRHYLGGTLPHDLLTADMLLLVKVAVDIALSAVFSVIILQLSALQRVALIYHSNTGSRRWGRRS